MAIEMVIKIAGEMAVGIAGGSVMTGIDSGSVKTGAAGAEIGSVKTGTGDGSVKTGIGDVLGEDKNCSGMKNKHKERGSKRQSTIHALVPQSHCVSPRNVCI